jgi:hypothetical protein
MFATELLRNIDPPERPQVHDIITEWTGSYNFPQFPKYTLFENCHYTGYEIFGTHVTYEHDVCKYFIWKVSTHTRSAQLQAGKSFIPFLF